MMAFFELPDINLGCFSLQQMVDEHCILLAMPCGRDHMDVLQQSKKLQDGFITYLQSKQAAGIVNSTAPGSHQVRLAPSARCLTAFFELMH